MAGSVLLLSVFLGGAHADSLADFLQDSGVKVGGWINAGVTFNPGFPGNGYNGPVTFADRANRIQLNQLNMYVQRTVLTEGASFDIGGRFDVMFGTDAIYTQAFGIPAYDVHSGQPLGRASWDLDLCCSSTRTYGIAIPQAYVHAYIPVGNGLSVKMGHFYSPTGYETAAAPDNFFYTRTYIYNNGEPITHTGLVGNYPIGKNWSLMAGATFGSATGGWDGGFDRQLGNWGGLGGATWTSDDLRSSLSITGTYGEISTRSSRFWGMYSIVLQHRIMPRTHWVLHHTHGYAGGVLLDGVPGDAEWLGVATYLYHDILEDLSVGIRGEWFRDRDGFRTYSPFRVAAATNHARPNFAGDFAPTVAPADYYAVTLGMNWKPGKRLGVSWEPVQKLNIRPNIRYDRASGIHQAYRPFDNRKDQILLSLDVMIPF